MSSNEKKKGFYRPGEAPSESGKNPDVPYSTGISLSKRVKRSDPVPDVDNGFEVTGGNTPDPAFEMPQSPASQPEPVCPASDTPCREESKFEPAESVAHEQVFGLFRNKPNSKAALAIVGIALVVAIVLTIALIPHTVDKSCDWCGRRPSVAYKTSDGSMAYVCKNCSSKCALCGKKAEKHYENLVGTFVFVCNNCYKQVTGK